MATYTKVILSGSTDGQPINVTATASPGDAIHTCGAGTSNQDEIWIWAVNLSAANVELTIQWGGTTSPDQDLVVVVPPEGLVLIVPGLILRNSLVVRAYADTTAVINLFGFANRITA